MDTSETYIKMCDCGEIQNIWNPEGLDFTHRRLGKQYKHGTMLWLPRQDQLQEMVGITRTRLITEFGTFAVCHEVRGVLALNYYRSMEQLWLAFVMKEKHDKVWDGESWMKKSK